MGLGFCRCFPSQELRGVERTHDNTDVQFGISLGAMAGSGSDLRDGRERGRRPAQRGRLRTSSWVTCSHTDAKDPLAGDTLQRNCDQPGSIPVQKGTPKSAAVGQGAHPGVEQAMYGGTSTPTSQKPRRSQHGPPRSTCTGRGLAGVTDAQLHPTHSPTPRRGWGPLSTQPVSRLVQQDSTSHSMTRQ